MSLEGVIAGCGP